MTMQIFQVNHLTRVDVIVQTYPTTEELSVASNNVVHRTYQHDAIATFKIMAQSKWPVTATHANGTPQLEANP
jgi:hypothetical protein